MTSSQFVHLRLHSKFSIADNLVHIDDVVKAAAIDSQPALAIIHVDLGFSGAWKTTLAADQSHGKQCIRFVLAQ